ncbi:PH domain-containing protein [Cryobacterium cryoconiti]|uniref:PH domain-containing protein n=1 Tax=Cryobacterium cryoconiti TaxID=1259239 RepID=A0A4Y8JVT7_9MICO|nr:PH domain-containing protein [Cryobacterium cryoconiti]TFD26913.1 PH domain-containing protein [Cryobacterium cryoconiti]
MRSPASAAVFVAVVLLCAALLADAAVRGRWDTALASTPSLAFVVWGAWLVFARPCLRLDAQGLTIVNVLRTTTVPWGEVDDLVLRHQVVVVTRSGERLVCWGAPSSARSSVATSRAPGSAREPSGRIRGSAAHRAIRGFWDRHETPQRAGEPIVRRWHRWSLLGGAALILGLAAQLA